MSRHTSLHALTFGLVALSSLAVTAAQAADPIHVRGSIASVDGTKVAIMGSDGKTYALTLGDAWRVGGVMPATLADIKQGTFIGTANVEGPDGNKALEVVVFPEAMRGTGERGVWDRHGGETGGLTTTRTKLNSAVKLSNQAGPPQSSN